MTHDEGGVAIPLETFSSHSSFCNLLWAGLHGGGGHPCLWVVVDREATSSSSSSPPLLACFSQGIWHCYWEYHCLHGIPGSDLTIYDIGFQTDFRVYLQLKQTWLAFSK